MYIFMKLVCDGFNVFTTAKEIHCGAKPGGIFADGSAYQYDDMIVRIVLNPDDTMDIWTKDGTKFRAEP
jgi:hypothetical protein